MPSYPSPGHCCCCCELLQVVVPPLLALVAAAVQVQATHGISSQQQRRRLEGTELQALGGDSGLQRQRALPPPPPYSGRWAGLAAAAALLLAAVVQPSLLAAPYLVVAVAAVWRWSAPSAAAGSAAASSSAGAGGWAGRAALQSYTAAYLLALYLWQAVLHNWEALQAAARLLGLFTLAPPGGEEGGGWGQLLPAAVQLVALLTLFLSLGAAAAAPPGTGDDGGRQQVPRGSRCGAGAGAARSRTEGQPLLADATLTPQHERAGAAGYTFAAPPTLRQLLPSLLLDAAAAGWELLSGRPGAVASLLLGTCLLQPSALGGVQLLLAVAALLAPAGATALQRLSRPLTGGLLLWLLACYGATVAAAVVSLPAEAAAAGLRAFTEAPWLQLLAMLLSAAAVAGLARARRLSSASFGQLSAGNLLLLDEQQALQAATGQQRLQQLLARWGSLRPPPARGIASASVAANASPATASAAEPPSPPLSTADDALHAPWQLAWRLLLRMLWYCCLPAVPVAVFAVGVEQYTVLHLFYLAGDSLSCLIMVDSNRVRMQCLRRSVPV